MVAKIIAHSKSSINGKELITYELTYPRIIHSEFMTHRSMSRNAASSRAIPINRLVELVESDCALPAEWGLNQAGMQAKGTHDNPTLCEEAWRRGASRAIETTKELQALGLHKQICNRPLEPFQFMKTIVTGTEWDNFFWLRDHEHADPTIAKLATEMLQAKKDSIATEVKPENYHLPYIYHTTKLGYYVINAMNERISLTLDEAVKVSVSCCAQVSYRLLDNSLIKALRIYDSLLSADRVHASPLEHIATPMLFPISRSIQVAGMRTGEHMDWRGNVWSGNFMGWEQYRQSVPNNTKWNK